MDGLFSDTDGDLWLGPYWYLLSFRGGSWQGNYMGYPREHVEEYCPLTLQIPEEYML